MLAPLPEFYCPYSSDCFECCLDTEMTLSEKDITRIEKLGYKIFDFLKEKDGFMVLTNIDGHCFFLKDKLCSIYEDRPQGCRFYPLIFDFELDDFIIDNLCVHHDDFNPEIYRPLFEPIKTFVYTLVGEKEIRVKKMKEEENQRIKEGLDLSIEDEKKSIEEDIKRIEELVEETIEDVTSDELVILEDALDEEMKDIEEEIKELEKGIEEEIKTMEEEVDELGEEIKKEIETAEEEIQNSFIIDEDSEEK